MPVIVSRKKKTNRQKGKEDHRDNCQISDFGSGIYIATLKCL